MNRWLCVFAVLMFGISAAFAQTVTPAVEAKEKLPIEIELLYYKLQNKAPDYDGLIKRAHIIPDDPKQFGQNALVAQQRLGLSKIYEQSGPGNPFLVKKNMQLAALDPNTRHAAFQKLSPDDPILYEGVSGDLFGVFLVNTDEMVELAPPFLYEDFPAINMLFKYNKFSLPSILTLNPIAADPKDFTLDDGRVVHVILAEVTELEVDHPEREKMLLQKQFKIINPKPTSSLSKMFNGVNNNPHLPGLPVVNDVR